MKPRRVSAFDFTEQKPAGDPNPGRPKVRLVTCPNCATSWYHEYVNDVGVAEGYCEYCAFEYRGPVSGRRVKEVAEGAVEQQGGVEEQGELEVSPMRIHRP